MKLWRDVPFEGLRISFGVSNGTAENYFNELLNCFASDLVPRLFYPLSVVDIDDMIPQECAEDLPGCKVIFDLTGFPIKSKENVLLSRILYSAYHHRPEVGVLFGEFMECVEPKRLYFTPSY
jgi:hypothetical protein